MESNVHQNKKTDRSLSKTLEWWDANIDDYETTFAKINAPFSFDLEWPFVNYHYKANLQDGSPNDLQLVKFLLDGQSSLQGPLFRIYSPMNQ